MYGGCSKRASSSFTVSNGGLFMSRGATVIRSSPLLLDEIFVENVEGRSEYM